MVTQGTSDSSASSGGSSSSSETLRSAFGAEHFMDSSSARCHCGLRLKVEYEMSLTNPGRRFVACPRRKSTSRCDEKKCDFFAWSDPPFPDQATKVIQGLLQANKVLSDSKADLVKHLNAKDAEIASVSYHYNEAKGFAEFMSDMNTKHEKEMEASGKEKRGLQLRLKFQNYLTGVLALLLALLCYLIKHGN